MKSIIAILISLSTTITNVSMAAEYDKPIAKGEQASFEGVLVPKAHYLEYSKSLRMEEFYKSELANIEIAKQKEGKEIEYGVFGVLVGVFLGSVVSGVR